MCDKKEIKCRMWHYRTTQSQRCSIDNNYNDDIVMHPSCGLNYFLVFFFGFVFVFSKTCDVCKGKHDDKEWDLN